MTMNKARLKISIANGLKMFLVVLIICSGIMFIIKQTEGVKAIYDEIQSYNKQAGVHLQVLPNALDLMGLSLQTPFVFESTEGTPYPIKIVFSLHLLILLLIPLSAVLISCYKSFRDTRSTTQHIIEYLETAIVFTLLSQTTIALNGKQVYFDTLRHFGITLEGSFLKFHGILMSFMLIFSMQLFFSTVFKNTGKVTGQYNQVLDEVVNGLKTYLKWMVLYATVLALSAEIWLLGTIGVKWQLGVKVLAGMGALPNFAVTGWGMLWGGELQGIVPIYGTIRLSLSQLGLWSAPLLVIVVGIVIKAVDSLSQSQFILKASLLGLSITTVNLVAALASGMHIRISSKLTILKLIPLLNETGEQYLQVSWLQVLVMSMGVVGLASAYTIIKRKIYIRN